LATETLGADNYAIARRYPRNKCILPITLVASGPGIKTTVRATTLDFSSDGLRIQAPVSLITGQQIDVLFERELLPSLPCEVVWTKPGGSFQPGEAGLKFVT
jgi:hypothetical protein